MEKKKSNFTVSSPEQSSGFLLWQVTTLWQRQLKYVLDELGLSHSGFVLLASLLWFDEKGREVTGTVLINHTKLDKMTVSKSLRLLEKLGYVTRKENLIDTRAKTIQLTAQGKKIAVKAVQAVEKEDRVFFSVIGQKDSMRLNEMFLKLMD